jgi:hypothetical protein
MARHAKITEIDKDTCRKIRDELNKVLEPFGKKFGLVVHAGNATYSENNAVFKVEVNTVDQDGNAISREAEAFTKNAFVYGLKPEHLNQTFKSFHGESFEIIGLATRSNKYPILAKNLENGKTYKFPAEQVKALLK